MEENRLRHEASALASPGGPIGRRREITIAAGENKTMPTFDDEPEAEEADQGAAPEASQEPLDLIPGFRDRLLMELEAAGVPPRRRIGELCRITGRASPTVRRWVDPEQPGLPDLESFARLCQSLKVDLNYILGLTGVRMPLPTQRGAPEADERWLLEVRSAAPRSLDGSEPMTMRGDDMAPRINDGDVLFVDRRVTSVAGNGTYVVEYMGRTMVRIIEDRFAEGFVLRCANDRYADVVVPQASIPSSEIKIAGKVVGRLSVTPV